MKLEINTVTKTVTILGKVNLQELTDFLDKNGWSDWVIQPEIKIEWLLPSQPYIQPVNPFSPPYTITY